METDKHINYSHLVKREDKSDKREESKEEEIKSSQRWQIHMCVNQLVHQRMRKLMRDTGQEISGTKQSLYLDGDYSRWSLENHITFPHLLKDSEGEGRTAGQSLPDITFSRLVRRGGRVRPEIQSDNPPSSSNGTINVN